MTYPALPDTIAAPAGPVTVLTALHLTDGGAAAYGLYDEATRVISVDGSLAPRFRWHTLYHEWAHVALMDSGVGNLFDERTIETLCDAFATARLVERFG
ncbi:MAG TPA: hypothetical protein VFM71_08745 [Gemmatimonadaceae bacterium]|nr:hypothetical protein [Gemmatimonadaceae bacterium]